MAFVSSTGRAEVESTECEDDTKTNFLRASTVLYSTSSCILLYRRILHDAQYYLLHARPPNPALSAYLASHGPCIVRLNLACMMATCVP